MARPSVTLAALGAAALLLLGEGIARYAGDQVCTGTPGHVYQADPAVGWTYVPNLRARVGRCDGSPLAPTRLETDARGLPLPSPAMPKPPDTVRVLLLGGMSADGIGVRPGYRLADHLAELADTRRGPRLEVVNLSMAGFTLDNDLLMWRDVGAALAPDAVLVMLDPASELVSMSRALLGHQGRNAAAKPWLRLESDVLVVEPAPPPPPVAPAATGLASRLAMVRLLGDLPARTGPPIVFSRVPPPPDDQIPMEHTRARALARALLQQLRDETRADGAALGVLLAPIPGEFASGTRAAPREWLVTTADDLGIPTLDLHDVLGFTDVSVSPVFAPGSMRWSGTGHLAAAGTVFQFLRERVLPDDGLQLGVGARALPRLDELAKRVRGIADGPIVGLVAWALAAVAVLWMAAPLSATVRDWVLVVVSLAVVAMASAPAVALAALGVVLAYYLTVELLPVWLGLPLGWLVLAAPAVAILAPDPAPMPGTYFDERLIPVIATLLLVLRLARYRAERRAGAPAASLRQYLAATLSFPTFAATPVVSPSEWWRLRGPGLVHVSTRDALHRHLRRSGLALARLGLGLVKLFGAPLVLGLLTPDAFHDGGAGVPRWRLWLWLLELPLLLGLVLSGLADVGIALAALIGVELPEEFEAPWRVSGPIDLWRRTNVTIAASFRRLIYRPLGGPTHAATRNVLLVFLAGGVWWSLGILLFAGTYFDPPSMWALPVCSALLLALGVLVARARPLPPATSVATGALRTAATYVFVAVAVLPLFVPGWQGPQALGRLVLRLVFLR